MQADDGSSGDELWEFDGSNVRLIKDFYLNYDGLPKHFATLDNKLYFSAESPDYGRELWVYDGVNEPTLVVDIRPGTDSANVQFLTVLGDKLTFSANDGVNGAELWQYNPATDSAQMVADINPGSSGGDVRDPVIYQNKLYFRAYESSTGRELWVYDGTNAPSMVFEGRAGTSSGYPEYMHVFKNKLYFQAHDASGDEELWVYDGTNAQLVAELNPTGYGGPSLFTEFNDKLYFKATDGVHGYELWEYDGVNTPSMVSDINPTGGANIQYPIVYDNQLMFYADDSVHGYELWQYDGVNPPSLFADINPGSNSSSYTQMIVFNDVLYFRANDGFSGTQLWSYDGTSIDLTKRIRTQTGDSNFAEPVEYNGHFYFVADDDNDTSQTHLWRFDGVSAPVIIDTFVSIAHLTVYNGNLYFAADDGLIGTEIWRYDGTNSQLAYDLNPTGNGDIAAMVAFNGYLYISGADSANLGVEMWQYDGSSAPVLIQDFDTRAGWSGYPIQYTVMNSVLYFTVSDEVNGRELWQYDGTNAPSMVADIWAGNRDSYPDHLKVVNNVLYFSAQDGINGTEIWQYDGTNPPSMLSDINVGYSSAYPDNLAEYNNELYFSANDNVNGKELWHYDGSNPPNMVADIHPTGGSSPSALAVFNNTLYFSAQDNTNGSELWQYDGTNPPSLAVDINTGEYSSRPQNLFVFNNQLYLTADARFENGRDVGEELYVLSFDDADVTVATSSTVIEPNVLDEDKNSPATAMDVFDFTISDGGTSDGKATHIKAISLKVSGTTTDIQREQVVWQLNSASINNAVGFYDATTNSLIFDNLALSIADGSSETFVVSAFYTSVAGLDDGLTYILSIDGDENLELDFTGSQMAVTSPVTNGTGTVVDINYAPIAGNTSATVIGGESVRISPSASDADNDPLSYRVSSQPSIGSVSRSGSSFVYTADSDSFGRDSFSYYVNDGKLNSNIATASIFVETRPTIDELSGIIVAAVDSSGTPASSVEITTFLESFSAEDIADNNLTLSHDAPDIFPLGVTTVTFTAMNYFGHSAVTTATVTVEDMSPPTITLTGESTLTIALNQEYTELGFSALDDVDGDLSASVVISGSVDTSVPGTYTITYSVTDQAGNVTEITRTVNVGNDAPVITINESQTAEAEGALTDVSLVYPEVTDDGTATEDIELSVSPLGPYSLGETTLTWTATDEFGASASVTQQLIVQDTTAPELLSPEPLKLAARGIYTDIANDFADTATDIVDGEIDVTFTAATRLKSGKHSVEITAVDSSGNASTAMLDVLIYPQLSLDITDIAEAGSTVQGRAVLSGESPEYPVNLELTVPEQVQIDSSSLQLEAGNAVSFSFVINEQVSANETLSISLSSALAMMLPNTVSSDITVIDHAIEPIVDLQLEQGGQVTQYLTTDGESVTLNALLTDVNSGDTHTVHFFSEVLGIDVFAENLTLDPALIAPGVYVISVTATENNTDEQLSTTSEFVIVVLETTPELSEVLDSDNDGIVDSEEGLADGDADGIPDFLDNDENLHNLPTLSDGVYMQTESGQTLRVGRFKLLFSDGMPADGAFTYQDFVQAFAGEFELHSSITPVSDVFNFVVDDLSQVGDTATVVIPLSANQTLPADSAYYKFDPDIGWFEFIEDGTNALFSAPKTADGNCPEISSSAYQVGLNAGDACIRLIIEDGGLYDIDKLANGQIEDPGMIATRSTNQAPVIELNASSFMVNEGEQITIDASQSYDVENDALSFSWKQLTGPSIEAELTNSASIMVTAPQVATNSQITLELTVSDDFSAQVEQVTIVVNNLAEPTEPEDPAQGNSNGGSMWYLLYLICLALSLRLYQESARERVR